MNYPLVYLEWEDVLASGADWKEEDETEEWMEDVNAAFTIYQTGFILKETKRYILLCSHYHPETKIAPKQFGHLQKILKSLITKRKIIKI